MCLEGKLQGLGVAVCSTVLETAKQSSKGPILLWVPPAKYESASCFPSHLQLYRHFLKIILPILRGVQCHCSLMTDDAKRLLHIYWPFEHLPL